MAISAALVSPGVSLAQDVDFEAQVRPRYEYRDPLDGGREDFTSMRVRLGLTAALDADVRLHVQMQDVRLWGEEGNTLGDFSADNLDLHQGYVEIGRPDGAGFIARVGRQEAGLGGERLIGAVGWTQQGRAFDGVRLSARREEGTVDLIGFKTAEDLAAGHVDDSELLGVYAALNVHPGSTLEPYALHVRETGETTTRETTVGARLVGTSGRWRWRFEGSRQFGERGDRDVSAFMLGGRVGAAFDDGRSELTLWYDLLSGDQDPEDDEVKVFNTLFATNHKFYGFADLFLDIPTHTAGHGLQDVAVKATVAATETFTVGADMHSFRLAQRGESPSDHLAEELDLTVRYRYSPHLMVTSGFSWVFAKDALGDIGRLSRDMTWGYVMLDAAF
jgi:hypothetical protein